MTHHPNSFIQSGQKALAHGERGRAATLFRQAILLKPSMVQGYTLLGAMMGPGQKPQLTARIFSFGVVASDQNDPKIWFRYADAIEKTGDINRAARVYHFISNRWSEFPPAPIRMFALLLAGNDTHATARYLRQILAVPNLNPNDAIEIGKMLLRRGQVGDARLVFHRATHGSLVQRAASFRGLAFACSRSKNVDAARKYMRLSLIAEPDDTDINKLFAILGVQDAPLPRQHLWCRRALCLQRDDPSLLKALALLYLAADELDLALAHSQRCLQVSARNFQAVSVHVDVLLKMNHSAALVDLANEVLVDSEIDNGLWNKIILAFDALKQPQEAIFFADKAVRKFPENAINHFNLGLFYHQEDLFDLAIPWFKQALVMRPDYAKAYNQLGLAVSAITHEGLADRFCCWAIFSNPTLATAWLNRGIYAVGTGHRREAIGHFRTAIACREGDYPDGYYNIALQLIALGDLQEGYDLYRWRWKTPSFPSTQRNYPQPEWPGPQEYKDGKLIVYAEQGMGDEVMYSWVFPYIRQQVSDLTIECDARLTGIFSRSFEDITFVPRRADMLPYADDPDIEFSAAVGNTVCYFIDEIKQRIASMKAKPIPCGHRSTPSLRTDPERRAHWKKYLHQEFGDKLVVGIAWRSSLHNRVRDLQYLSPEEISAALGFDVGVVNLQYSYTADEHAAFCALGQEKQFKFVTPPDIDLKNDLDDVFALIEAVDVVISPLISVPWMAAAVGTPCFVTRHDATGRLWQQLGTDFLPFGPGINVFFRSPTQSWDFVLSQIKASLATLVAQKQ